MNGYEALRTRPDHQQPVSFSINPAYEEYLKIHKVLVGPKTAPQLECIAESLGQETFPRYLVTAGWSAVEASIAQPHRSTHHRNELLSQAETHWLKALEYQLALNQSDNEVFIEADAPFRTALDIARLPLIRGMVMGSITPALRKSVRGETLAILNSAAAQGRLALEQGAVQEYNELYGFMHEGNALAALDSFDSATLFGIASFARSDSGHHHPDQTHDIVVVQQKNGLVRSMTPVEIKSKSSAKDRERYKALLVRGKMHLCMPGAYSPEYTLSAFTALDEDKQTVKEKLTTDLVRQTFIDMFWQYKCGTILGDIATSRSRLHFRDKTSVFKRYPETAPPNIRRELTA